MDSTQIQARRELKSARFAPFWVLAKEQTQGRGRADHGWQSQYGNYSGTLVWPIPANRADAPKYSLLAALALMRVFLDLELPEIAIKWPNDVLIKRRKAAGILVEAEGEHLLVGVGVNLVQVPHAHDLQARAIAPIALSEMIAIEFEEFHERFSQELISALIEFESNGFSHAREELRQSMLVREDMVLQTGQSRELVQPHDLGENGQLIVLDGHGKREIYAGDLWIKDGA